ncbi:hypothetical protein ACFWBN_27935 [Streptomyces sp. NPDC059989]|uniref:hypothetical protein n=1 Tax=Streptomyces sp. NPDC059989 TaxID=3347026 RepID=UPI0036C84163
MTDRSENTGTSKKRRWVRWVLGVPLGLLHLLSAAAVYSALRYGPLNQWDDQGHAGTTAMALFAIIFSVIAILITLIPPVRRTMGLWWLVPPVVLGVIAWVRIATLG